LELLAPAKNLAFGIEAINHGADAVYIGGPGFGARANAGNPVADIGALAEYAHRFRARVLVAFNTLLKEEELAPAQRLIQQLYDAGADALIVQDMGILEMALPPIQLHASTQTDIRNPAKARFLESVGFAQLVLARELSLEQIRAIAEATTCQLEYFVHGALCVSYSGQCYISHALTGRSANRGECAQICRLPFTLAEGDGKVLAQDQHLLSLKDNNQSDNLAELAAAGISSFKIEGRLKDLAYVKNITAFYRQRLDALMEGAPHYRPASAGRTTLFFTPRPDKTFNRGYTDYFTHGRQGDIAAFGSPKFVGEAIGRVSRVDPQRRWFEVASGETFQNGDGIAFYDDHGELTGLRINRAEGKRLFSAEILDKAFAVGTALYRNRDQAFERQLERRSAERKIGIAVALTADPDGLHLRLGDPEGVTVRVRHRGPLEPARDPERARATLREQLTKLGGTDFVAARVDMDLATPPFLPAAAVNALRREAVAALEAARAAAYRRPAPFPKTEPPLPYPETQLSYLGNIANSLARRFYQRHGVTVMANAYEANEEKGAVSLMITKHCLRHSFDLCPKEHKGLRADPMTLTTPSETLSLRFDCARCEMHVVGSLKRRRG